MTLVFSNRSKAFANDVDDINYIIDTFTGGELHTPAFGTGTWCEDLLLIPKKLGTGEGNKIDIQVQEWLMKEYTHQTPKKDPKPQNTTNLVVQYAENKKRFTLSAL